MSEEVPVIRGQLYFPRDHHCRQNGKTEAEVREKSVELVGHFYTSGVNLKTKPILKEKRLVFPLNDTQLFLPLPTFLP